MSGKGKEMVMLKRVIFILAWIQIFSGCSAPLPQPIEATSTTPAQQNPSDQLAALSDLLNLELAKASGNFTWDDNLSPDAQTLAFTPPTPQGQIRVLTVSTRQEYVFQNLPDEKDLFQSFLTWSPDSSKIAVVGKSVMAPVCGEDRVSVYHLTADHKITGYRFYPNEDKTGCIRVAWSPDSTRLAVTDAEKNVYIYDTQGKLLQSLTFPHNRIALAWMPSGLFVHLSSYEQNRVPEDLTEIHVVDLEAGNSRLVWRESVSAGIMAQSPDGQKLLLAYGGEKSGQMEHRLAVLEIASGAIQQELTYKGTRFISDRQYYLALPWVAFIVTPPDQAPASHLFLFDWKTLRMVDYTAYDDFAYLIGWRSGIDGFLIINHQQDHSVIDAVFPK
jgi:Tol biopolymer transport system component